MGSGRDKRKKVKGKTPGAGAEKTAKKTVLNEQKAQRRALKNEVDLASHSITKHSVCSDHYCTPCLCEMHYVLSSAALQNSVYETSITELGLLLICQGEEPRRRCAIAWTHHMLDASVIIRQHIVCFPRSIH